MLGSDGAGCSLYFTAAGFLQHRPGIEAHQRPERRPIDDRRLLRPADQVRRVLVPPIFRTNHGSNQSEGGSPTSAGTDKSRKSAGAYRTRAANYPRFLPKADWAARHRAATGCGSTECGDRRADHRAPSRGGTTRHFAGGNGKSHHDDYRRTQYGPTRICIAAWADRCIARTTADQRLYRYGRKPETG